MAYLLEDDSEYEAIHIAQNTASARVSIIVCGAMLDATLERALRRRLIDKKDLCDKMFDSKGGPLGPYAGKVNLGYLLGMYNERERSALSGIGYIRNDFAHKLIDERSLVNSDDFKKYVKRLVLQEDHEHFPKLEELQVGGVRLLSTDRGYPDNLRFVFINNYRIMQQKLVLDQFYHKPHSNEVATPTEIIQLMDQKYGSRDSWLRRLPGRVLLGPQKN